MEVDWQLAFRRLQNATTSLTKDDEHGDEGGYSLVILDQYSAKLKEIKAGYAVTKNPAGCCFQ